MTKQKNKIKKAKKLLNKLAPKGERLAYINEREAKMLKKAGGLGKDINNTGIKSYVDFGGPGEGYGTASDTFGAASGATPSGPSRSDFSGGDSGYTSPKGKGPEKTVSVGGSGTKGGGSGTMAALSVIGKTAFDVSGLGLAYKYGKKGLETIQQKLTPQVKKDTAQARLSGSFTTKYQMKRQPTVDLGGGGDNQPIQPLKITTIINAQQTKPTFSANKFFPFKAYNDGGGVKSGPPPKSGPNSQVPPVKMRNGKMTKTYKFSCPSRPDGIRGMGKALRGHKFTGVK